jgi:hypothetical protein
MLQTLKRALLQVFDRFGYSIVKHANGSYTFVPNVLSGAPAPQSVAADGDGIERSAAEVEAKRREVVAWSAAEQNRLAAQRRDAEAWIAAEEEKIARRHRDADAWIAVEVENIAEQRRSTEAWVAAEVERIEAQRRAAEIWVGDVIDQPEQADATVSDAAAAPDTATGDDEPSLPIPQLGEFKALMDSIPSWSGRLPANFFSEGFGILTRNMFKSEAAHQLSEERDALVALPPIEGGEGWFEMVDWLISAREAIGEYVVVSLGANYGAQLVGAWTAMRLLNPLPSLLVAVEAVPENCRRIVLHMADNGIDANDHVIIQAAIAPNNEAVLFPVGAPGSGRNNGVATNSPLSRAVYAQVLGRASHAPGVVRNLMLRNSTGTVHDLGDGVVGEVKFVSAVTLGDVIGPLRRVDLLEVDIQQAEGEALPPFIGVMSRKVRRVHVGTHGAKIHGQMRTLFRRAGWTIVFDFAPDSSHQTEFGSFKTIDGILTAVNPAV